MGVAVGGTAFGVAVGSGSGGGVGVGTGVNVGIGVGVGVLVGVGVDSGGGVGVGSSGLHADTTRSTAHKLASAAQGRRPREAAPARREMGRVRIGDITLKAH